MKHTPGRLFAANGNRCYHEDGGEVLVATKASPQHRPMAAENARRAVDCWNACEGMVNPKYEVEHLLGAIDAITDALPKIERAGNSMELDAALDCLRPFARKHGRAV